MSTGRSATAQPPADRCPDNRVGGVGGVSRRRLFADTARTACGAALFGLAVGLYSRQSRSMPASAIRPPGALAEKDFLGACARCGLCARDCPYGILRLSELGENVAAGTPYFVARQDPCRMCTNIPCVPACPTGALDHALTDITKARMGLAVLIDRETCIAFQGNRCEVCFNACPLRGKALKLDYRPNPRTGNFAIFAPAVASQYCTGCGLCERACILEEAAIKVMPLGLAKGASGTPDHGSEYTAREGRRAGYFGRGPVFREAVPAMPFSASPLDTLNNGIAEAR